MKSSEIITFCYLCSQAVELLCRRSGYGFGGFQLSLANGMHDFNAGNRTAGAQKDLKPSMGRVSRLTARWSCSTMLLRYLHCRIVMAVLWILLGSVAKLIITVCYPQLVVFFSLTLFNIWYRS